MFLERARKNRNPRLRNNMNTDAIKTVCPRPSFLLKSSDKRSPKRLNSTQKRIICGYPVSLAKSPMVRIARKVSLMP
jgi:hypothetical protein